MAKKKEKKGVFNKKILGKPTAKVKGISAEKVVSQLAATQSPLVRPVESTPPVQDNRSLFFKQEFEREQREAMKF